MVIVFTAIWLLPKHNGYGEWPASGEIDLVESRGEYILSLILYRVERKTWEGWQGELRTRARRLCVDLFSIYWPANNRSFRLPSHHMALWSNILIILNILLRITVHLLILYRPIISSHLHKISQLKQRSTFQDQKQVDDF